MIAGTCLTFFSIFPVIWDDSVLNSSSISYTVSKNFSLFLVCSSSAILASSMISSQGSSSVVASMLGPSFFDIAWSMYPNTPVLFLIPVMDFGSVVNRVLCSLYVASLSIIVISTFLSYSFSSRFFIVLAVCSGFSGRSDT